MAGIFGGGSQAKQTPAVAGLNLNSSVYGKVIPVVWGTVRIAANLLWYANFRAHPHQQKVGKGGGCFRGSVRVSTPHGPRRIMDMAEGDQIFCRDPMTGARVVGHVAATSIHRLGDTPDRMLELVCANGVVLSGVTNNHHVWGDGGAEIEAGELRPGMGLSMIDGARSELFTSREIASDPDEQVHNLTVEPWHNYFAGGVLVHNFGGGKGSVTYTYTVDLIWGLCHGAILNSAHPDGLLQIYIDKTTSTLAAQNLTFFEGGSPTQAVWSYLSSHYPSQAIPYPSIVYVGANPLNLGSNATLPNFNFEVQRIRDDFAFSDSRNPEWCVPAIADGLPLPYLPAITPYDVNPDWVVRDILTNGNYGVGFDTAPALNQVGENAYWQIGNLEVATDTATLSEPFYRLVNATSDWFSLPVEFGSDFTLVAAAINISVIRADGMIYQSVSGTPAPGQYNVIKTSYNLYYQFDASEIGNSFTFKFAVRAGFLDYFYFTYFNKLWISPAYIEQRAATEVLQEIATNTFAEFVWSSGYLQLRPRVKLNTDGSVRTLAPEFDLTDDDFLPNQAGTGSGASTDPVQVMRKRISDQINQVQLEFLDRSNRYAPAMAIATDQAISDAYGLRSTGSQQAHLFCDAQAANSSAWLQLQMGYIRANYYFTLDMRYVVLDPMDIVTLTDAALGLDRTPVRILEMTENTDGSINFMAEDYPLGIGGTASYALNQGQGYVPDTNADPGDVNVPIIFAAPTQLTNGALQIWGAVSGASPNWGGCTILISTDGGSSYNTLGQQFGPARMGTLNSLLPVAGDPDLTNMPTVDLTESFGDLVSVTQAEADQLLTISLVDSEFIAYETATLTAPYTYQLSYLRRALYGSTQSIHMSAPFVRLDQNIFTFPYQSSMIGETVYLKFTSFNIFQTAEQNPADVTAYPYVIGGPPDASRFNQTQAASPDWPGTLSGFLVTWDGILVPDSTVLASGHTNAQLFTQFVPFPVASPTYSGPVFDLGVVEGASVTIRAAAVAPGGGMPVNATALDYWSTGADPNSFAAFSTGTLTGRYFRARITQNTTTPSFVTALALNLFN